MRSTGENGTGAPFSTADLAAGFTRLKYSCRRMAHQPLSQLLVHGPCSFTIVRVYAAIFSATQGEEASRKMSSQRQRTLNGMSYNRCL